MKLTTVKQISDVLKKLNVSHKVEGYRLTLNGVEIEESEIVMFTCRSGNCICYVDYFELNDNKDILLGIYNRVLCNNLFLAKIEG